LLQPSSEHFLPERLRSLFMAPPDSVPAQLRLRTWLTRAWQSGVTDGKALATLRRFYRSLTLFCSEAEASTIAFLGEGGPKGRPLGHPWPRGNGPAHR
jgi:hypothetical protein